MEIILYLIVAWPCLGILGFFIGLLFDGFIDTGFEIDYVSEFMMGFFLGPITLIINLEASFENSQKKHKKALSKKKREATKKKKKEEALENFSTLLKKLNEEFLEIKQEKSAPSRKFFTNAIQISQYCTALDKNEIEDKDQLKKILIFIRLNILQFYENNNIEGSGEAIKKITNGLKKIQ